MLSRFVCIYLLYYSHLYTVFRQRTRFTGAPSIPSFLTFTRSPESDGPTDSPFPPSKLFEDFLVILMVDPTSSGRVIGHRTRKVLTKVYFFAEVTAMCEDVRLYVGAIC